MFRLVPCRGGYWQSDLCPTLNWTDTHTCTHTHTHTHTHGPEKNMDYFCFCLLLIWTALNCIDFIYLWSELHWMVYLCLRKGREKSMDYFWIELHWMIYFCLRKCPDWTALNDCDSELNFFVFIIFLTCIVVSHNSKSFFVCAKVFSLCGMPVRNVNWTMHLWTLLTLCCE